MKRLFLSMGMAASLSLFGGSAFAQGHPSEPPREARTEEITRIMHEMTTEAREVEVLEAPPAPRPEHPRPTPPRPHAVWVPGFWHWDGTRASGHWVWIGGHFDTVEHDGAIWVQPHYDHRAGGHIFYVHGHWQGGAHPH